MQFFGLHTSGRWSGWNPITIVASMDNLLCSIRHQPPPSYYEKVYCDTGRWGTEVPVGGAHTTFQAKNPTITDIIFDAQEWLFSQKSNPIILQHSCVQCMWTIRLKLDFSFYLQPNLISKRTCKKLVRLIFYSILLNPQHWHSAKSLQSIWQLFKWLIY